MHTGGPVRATPSTPAASCPATPGTIVRDGYAGYAHLTDALHAWCGAHLLRDLKGLYRLRPGRPGLGRGDGRPAHRRPRRRRRRPRRRAGQPSTPPSWTICRPLPGAAADGLARQLPARAADRQGRAAARPPVPRPRGHDPALRHRPDRRLHQQRGRARRPPGQGPAAHLRRMLAHPPRPRRLRRSSSPTCPPPPNGASTPSTPSPGSSPTAPGSRPQPRPHSTAADRRPHHAHPPASAPQRQRAISRVRNEGPTQAE